MSLRAPVASPIREPTVRVAGRRQSIWLVSAAIVLIHGLWIGAYLASGHEVRDFIKIGYLDVQRSHVSAVIKFDPAYHYPPNHDAPNGTGFDGQYSYYIALDPANARYYIDADETAYRYTRILYPMTARVLALGQPAFIPYTLLFINWLSVGLGTLALATWLRRKGLAPWIAVIFGLYPGLLISLQRDLTEPLAYALVAAGVYFYDFGGRRRLMWAAIAFALAGLAREVSLVFGLLYALDVLRQQRWRGLGFLALVGLPLGLYELFLLRWLGSLSSGGGIALIPFSGLLTAGKWQLSRQPPEIIGVVIPALICGGLALRGLVMGIRRIEVFALIANVLLLVILLPDSVYTAYTSAGRVTVAVVLAALTCLPYYPQLELKNRLWLWAPAAMWLSIWPAAMFYGFATTLRV